uniref:Uncharacterized protein n=1 Tax=Chlamydomonas euryale TaxID=1486919 RepID=A0A7R9VNU8_9CHLO|mmetsp:Transcript_40593/g.121106  ORF Transcript_40593/g.121106 Transcript_40593/m.121106 type:complete len:103 (+) Transcript_40593:148-456(+)|eukprot:344489-Chlamydomonas_euryale.AAC.1
MACTVPCNDAHATQQGVGVASEPSQTTVTDCTSVGGSAAGACTSQPSSSGGGTLIEHRKLNDEDLDQVLNCFTFFVTLGGERRLREAAGRIPAGRIRSLAPE